MQAEAISAPPVSRLHWALDVVILFVISRVVLGIFLLWTQNALYDYPNAVPLSFGNRWDAALYLDVIQNGYINGTGHTTAQLFPMYPLLIGAAHLIVPSWEWAALLASNLCLLGAMLTIYRLVLDETSDAALARRTLLYMLIFPTGYYFSAAYTESLLVMLGALTVLCARRRQWGWAILFCALASASRVVGLIFAVYIGLEWARSHGWRLTSLHRTAAWRGLLNGLRSDWLVPVLLPLAGLGLFIFMRYLGQSYGDPLRFSTGQVIYGNTDPVPFSLFVRDFLFVLLHTYQGSSLRFMLFTNYAIWFAALAACIPLWRRFGPELAVLSLLVVLSPAAALSVAIGRYAIASFPVFIGMALWARNPRLDRLMTIVFIAVQAGLIISWMRGPFFA